jgi:hypothetical protein
MQEGACALQVEKYGNQFFLFFKSFKSCNFCRDRLELNGHRRRLTWEAAPRSIHDGIQSAIMSSDCLVFDTNIAQLFADHGNLGINVTISVCER